MSIQRKAIVVFIYQEHMGLEQQRAYINDQEAKVRKFLSLNPHWEILDYYYQVSKKQKMRNRWVEVKKALHNAVENNADIIFSNIEQYHSQVDLGSQLLAVFSKHRAMKLHCLDQKFINEKNICEIVKHFLQRRQKHGALIKEGLVRSGAKSGNPNAAQVIAKVNRPKILCSISYSLMFEPVISFYEAKGLPQRKIVDQLNEQGLCAPEGGHWVLSQFQKVLERVRLNRLAFETGAQIKQMREHVTFETISQSYEKKFAHLLPKGKKWTPDLVEKVYERHGLIQDLIEFNNMFSKYKFVLEEQNWLRLSHSQTCELILNQQQPLPFKKQA